jgi:hypothetical protein
MALDDLVKINISASTVTPSQAGFGTLLIAAQKVPAAFTMRTRVFGSLTEMTDFGFVVSDPAYKAAQKIKAQNPSVTSWKVGRRANKLTQSIRLKCMSAVQGDIYQVTVNGTALTRTVPASSTTTLEATAIAALIAAVSGVTASASTDTVTVTVTAGAGLLNDVTAWSTNLQLTDGTTDPGGSTGLANDLAAIYAADTDWYGLVLDSNSGAEITIAALFTETNKKLFVANSSDYGCEDSTSTTDIMFTLKSASYARTGTLYSRSQLLSYSGAAWMAKQFTQTPGSDTWKFKTLASVLTDTLTAAGRAGVLAKSGNIYTATSSVAITENGTSASGEFLDVTRFVDWLRARLQFLMFTAFVNNSKIPFTDPGMDLVQAILQGGLDDGVASGGLAPGSTSVFVPKALNVPGTDRAARKLTGVRFAGRLAGAVHELAIDGTITV